MVWAYFRHERKRRERRAWPIHGYTGSNGGGKSAAMVWDTIPSLEAGRPVLSTVRVLDYLNPRECSGCDDPEHERPIFGPVRLADEVEASTQVELGVAAPASLYDGARLLDGYEDNPLAAESRLRSLQVRDGNGFPIRDVIGYGVHKAAHPLWVPFREWEQLLEAKSCDVLMDEVTGVGSSRESMGMPAPVANKLVQLRRADVVLRWSAPAWARADKIIRECSQAVTYCVGRMPARVQGEGVSREWRQRRLFQWRTYDAQLFEDFTSGKREQLPALTRDLHWGPGSPAFDAYDTFDGVLTVGTVSDAGRCYRCGGRRTVPACSCDGHAPRAARGGPERRQAGGQPRRTPLPLVGGDDTGHPAPVGPAIGAGLDSG